MKKIYLYIYSILPTHHPNDVVWVAIAMLYLPPSVDMHLVLLSPSDLAGDQGHFCCPGSISSIGSRQGVG